MGSCNRFCTALPPPAGRNVCGGRASLRRRPVGAAVTCGVSLAAAATSLLTRTRRTAEGAQRHLTRRHRPSRSRHAHEQPVLTTATRVTAVNRRRSRLHRQRGASAGPSVPRRPGGVHSFAAADAGAASTKLSEVILRVRSAAFTWLFVAEVPAGQDPRAGSVVNVRRPAYSMSMKEFHHGRL